MFSVISYHLFVTLFIISAVVSTPNVKLGEFPGDLTEDLHSIFFN
jgi:hypothetical protein